MDKEHNKDLEKQKADLLDKLKKMRDQAKIDIENIHKHKFIVANNPSLN